MTVRRCFATIPILLLAAMAALFAMRGLAAPERSPRSAEVSTEELLAIRDQLLRVQPLLERIEKMEDLLSDLHATSPTLERLDEIQVKASAIAQLSASLARLEKIEPALKALEEIQRSYRPRTGGGLQKLGEVLAGFEKRIAALEKRLYAPPALRDPAAMRKSIEQRLEEMDEQQSKMAAELEKAQRELQRLRRENRDRF